MINFNPPPTACKSCGTILQWILAAQYNYECPTCALPACFVCGCTDTHPCQREVSNNDRTSSQTYTCSWTKYGPCSSCLAGIAQDLYTAAASAGTDAITSPQLQKGHLSRDNYIDPRDWAIEQGIEIIQAEEQLNKAVEAGKLQRLYLYEGSDSPITFLVTEEMLGESIKLSDLGYFGDEQDQEILVSPLRARPVYAHIPDVDLLQTLLSEKETHQ